MIFLSDNRCEYTLPRATLYLWQCRSAAVWLLIVGICTLYLFRIKHFLIALIIIAVLFAVFTFVYLPKLFASYKIRRISDAVVINLGVIFHSTHILPFSRLIYAQKIKSPIARKFNLTALMLKAARTWLFVPEMTTADAERFLEDMGG